MQNTRNGIRRSLAGRKEYKEATYWNRCLHTPAEKVLHGGVRFRDWESEGELHKMKKFREIALTISIILGLLACVAVLAGFMCAIVYKVFLWVV